MTMTPSNILYLSHGGGPFPLLGEPSHQHMVEQLKAVTATIAKPKRILLISAHWEESSFTVTGNPQPDLIYDYYGFPEEAYRIQYPAEGDPEFAAALSEAAWKSGTKIAIDPKRGYDHGMFVPLKLMYPDADVPVVQLSLAASLNASLHVRLGEALQAADLTDTLVIGSGFSFHNMKAFFRHIPSADEQNDAFQYWLKETVESESLSEGQRAERLINWETTAPHARFCHPREEHLLPLHVCYGLANQKASRVEQTDIAGKTATLALW
ncbi:DODA-type extradiol aromatic ring-opening family dioxygenase [Alteromonas confluentis]|uniref:Dioxygenase n=1 Tax=Alteromonas confluentis TaxID=1656094 RepID=A0A1E7ZGN5_9ALTE|nr:class III extradiol ring-cleavage dioxygenase [Alteromonas confluentis]OFC72602.1 dioxygenase [Alteromonas confluentis]